MITEESVIAAAGVDPRALQALLAAGQPDAIAALSRAFEDAGQASAEAYRRGARAHQVVGESFTNDGLPVLDAAAQTGLAGRNLGNAGQDLTDAATLLRSTVPALEGAQQTGQRAVSGMQAALAQLFARWNRFATAAAASGGPTAADEQRLLADGIRIVTTAATTVQGAVDGYDAVLRRGAGELRGRGYVEDPAGLAAHLAVVPEASSLSRDAAEAVARTRQVLAELGVPIGIASAALALNRARGLVGKGRILAQFYRSATAVADDPTQALLDEAVAARALQRFKTGFPLAGEHARLGAVGTLVRGLQESRIARVAGEVSLPLTAVEGFEDLRTGGGYSGARGVATRVFGTAGGLGAGALFLGLATGPIGATVAGTALLGYTAWSIGNTVYDHRAEIAAGYTAASTWAGDRLHELVTSAPAGRPPAPTRIPHGAH